MSNNEIFQKVCNVYQYFMRLTFHPKFVFYPTTEEKKLIRNFSNPRQGNCNNSYLYDLFLYRFCMNFILLQKPHFKLNDVISNEAIQQYKKSTFKEKYVAKLFHEKNNLQNPLSETNFLKSKERQKYYNNVRGMINCVEKELFDKYCNDCIFCKFNHICNQKNT